jgi:hypothetical protein
VLLALLISVPLLSVVIWLALGLVTLNGRGDGQSATEFRRTSFCVAAAALQFMIASLALAVLILARSPEPQTVLLAAICWPMLIPIAPLYLEYVNLAQFGPPLVVGVAATLSIAGLYWTTMRGRLRNLWPTIAASAFFVGFVPTAEWQFHSELVRAAAALKPECMDARSFLQSIKNSQSGAGFDLHAAAEKAGKLYAWSFHKNDFYVVPEKAIGNVRVLNSSWFSLPYPSCHTQ